MNITGEPISRAVPEKITKDTKPLLETLGQPERKSFGQRAMKLYNKFGLIGTIPNIEVVIEDTRKFSETHGLSDEFLNDEINLELLLGCAQKLREATDPRYRRRIEDFERRLVAPVVKNGILDSKELWGSGSERAGLEKEEAKVYVASKKDHAATQAFIEKYTPQITRCKEAWKSKGYDLDVQVHIVADDVMEFRRNLRAGGYVQVPEKEELPTGNGNATIELVLLQNYSAEKDNMVRHEFYHVEDYWGFVRRGYQGSILESVDELHTEFAAGNYDENHSKDPFSDSAYFTLKEFWDKLSYVGDLDFNLLANRNRLVEDVARNYGLDGLVDFSLIYAHGDGKTSIFETFYNDHERPIMDLLIAREKLNLRRAIKNNEINSIMTDTAQVVIELGEHCTPADNYWSPKYISVYDILPSKDGKVWSVKPTKDGNTQLENDKAKKMVVGYTRAIAYAELYHQGEIDGQEDVYRSVITSLESVPHRRSKVNFTPDLKVSQEFEISRSYKENDDECYKDIIHGMYFDLTNDMTGIDFAFSLQNPQTRGQILDPFLTEVGLLAKYCVNSKRPEFVQWLVDGIYGYNTTPELREFSVDYLIKYFPVIAPVLEAKRASFDSKKVSNFSF